MKKLLLLFLGMPLLISAQVFDDFSDGNFIENPSWKGTQEKFKVNTNKQLQLDDAMESVAFLTTANSFLGETEWQLWIKLGFSPSSNNNARIYLVSNQEDISESLNGYFIQLGESGSNDAIELFRQKGETATSVCRGSDGLLASAFEIRLKITRDLTGLWKVYVDPLGGENFQLQCKGTDNEISETTFFGLFCKYTVSNSTKFYFDDIYAGPLIVDTLPPELTSLKVESDTSLQLVFSEVVDSLSAVNRMNYSVRNGIGNPRKAFVNPGSFDKVNLLFDQQFENGNFYTLSVSGVEDLAGNVMEDTELEFSFYQPNAFDVVFNEIMADPSPQVGLPNQEYLELFNRTDHSIELNNWTLTIGSSEKKFESVTIESNDFLILGHLDAETELSVYGPFYGFSSFSLTNSGQTLVLDSPDGDTISQLRYSENWYNDLDKKDGGWSLEQINPENICSAADNWKASENNFGGTPGERNSVFQDVLIAPKVERFEMVSANKLKVFFTQRMNPDLLSNTYNYSVDQNVGNPSQVLLNLEEPEKAELYFDESFLTGKVYLLTLSKSLENCIGLSLEKDTVISFGIGEMALENDVVINEILFNPWTKGVDYVEIYNRSTKVIDLSSLSLGTGKISPPNPIDTSFYKIVEEQFLMVPQSYLVLSSSTQAVKNQYYTTNPQGFIQMERFPAYNNDEGICLLVNTRGELVDVFDYSEEMHYPLLNFHDGVSLERISPEMSTQDADNWHSAAESVGFGTPAYKNSQFLSPKNGVDEIIIEPEIFSPDNDGYNDNLSIVCNFVLPGYTITVNIYDANGRMVRKLANNQYVGTEGVLIWNGIQDDNTKAPIGIYVLFIQVFDLDGNVKQFKKTAVLASKL